MVPNIIVCTVTFSVWFGISCTPKQWHPIQVSLIDTALDVLEHLITSINWKIQKWNGKLDDVRHAYHYRFKLHSVNVSEINLNEF